MEGGKKPSYANVATQASGVVAAQAPTIPQPAAVAA